MALVKVAVQVLVVGDMVVVVVVVGDMVVVVVVVGGGALLEQLNYANELCEWRS